ncbi:hypothetical protein Tco_0847916 [Tanacetum coccineum]
MKKIKIGCTFYSPMMGVSLLNCSRPDIMFAVLSVCKIQVTPKAFSHLHASKRTLGTDMLFLSSIRFSRSAPINLLVFIDPDLSSMASQFWATAFSQMINDFRGSNSIGTEENYRLVLITGLQVSARDAQVLPTQSAAQASISTAQDTAGTQGTAQAQDTDEVQDTDPAQGTAAIPKSPNDYTPTDASQTSGGDEDFIR